MELDQRRRIASLLPPHLCAVEQDNRWYLARREEPSGDGDFGRQIISREIHFGSFDDLERYLQIIRS